MRYLLPVLLLFGQLVVKGQASSLLVSGDDLSENIILYEHSGLTYFSAAEFAGVLSIPYETKDDETFIEFPGYILKLSAKNPFIVLTHRRSKKSEIHQLPTPVLMINNQVCIPLNYSLEALSLALGKKLKLASPGELVIGESYSAELFMKKNSSGEAAHISSVSVREDDDGTFIRIFSDKKIASYKSYYKDGNFVIILRDVNVNKDAVEKSGGKKGTVKARNINKNAEIKFRLKEKYSRSEITEVAGTDDLLIKINNEREISGWFESESENFRIIYKEAHSFLVPYLLNSAESTLKFLMELFNYTPSEIIVINTVDYSDYGFGASTSVPANYIRLEIEPLEPGYENAPHNDRFRWLLAHEIVHIVVNDKATGTENFSRTLFSKVAPEQVQPITVFYSLLTNFSRYTPRWHQEAAAVFMETWISGGFGRTLGSFDEMYFRTMVLDKKEFPSQKFLDSKLYHNSLLLENIFYLYGTRFASYLALNYGADKVVEWFKIKRGDFYKTFQSRFEEVFKKDFNNEWKRFIAAEKKFQKKNLAKLNSAPLTPVKRLSTEGSGWVTQPHYDPVDNSVIYGYHQSHQLAGIKEFNLKKRKAAEIITLPTPSLYQVASTAYDKGNGLFFYTANNNQLYRDLLVIDLNTGEKKMLFENCRIGHLSVSPVTHDLWGVQHENGKARIVFSRYPYRIFQQILQFKIGEELQQVSVSPSGKYLSAVLLSPNGKQSIILLNSEALLSGTSFYYETVTSSGSPENPSWSDDEKYLYWNAYTNGVSNIYRKNFSENSVEAVSHTLRGLFRPVHLNDDSLFCFEFSTEGFIPSIIPNKPAEKLPAINYLGQEVVKKNSQVYNWFIKPAEVSALLAAPAEEEYSGFSNLKIQAFIPVITGFQKQKVVGIFTHIADPLLFHDFIFEFGVSPFKENKADLRYHVRAKYEYRNKYSLGIDYNAADFYDLFNKRKRGMMGTKISLGHLHYWVYDNPLKIKQQTEIAAYTDVEFLNDNLIPVTQPDFLVAQTIFNSRSLRKTIGSADYEYGNEFTLTAVGFGADRKDPKYAGQLYGEWDYYTTFLMNHNVFHFKIAGGYHWKNEDLYQARFFFGGFGNRALENADAKQFRNVFRFPGVPIYSIPAENFVKLMLEENFPPIRFGNLYLGSHHLSHIDFSAYSQGLLVKSPVSEKFANAGAQINLVFIHWYNLESTLSAGIAGAWYDRGKDWEWFISYKLLKN